MSEKNRHGSPLPGGSKAQSINAKPPCWQARFENRRHRLAKRARSSAPTCPAGEETMKIRVYGAGLSGGLIASAHARDGHAVSVIARGPQLGRSARTASRSGRRKARRRRREARLQRGCSSRRLAPCEGRSCDRFFRSSGMLGQSGAGRTDGGEGRRSHQGYDHRGVSQRCHRGIGAPAGPGGFLGTLVRPRAGSSPRFSKSSSRPPRARSSSSK